MQNHIQTLVKHLFEKESFEQVTVQELKQFTEAYPYAAVGQFLYAKKLYDARSWNYYEQTEQASLYFHNPLWFRWIMDLKYDGPVVHFKEEAPVQQPEAPQSAYRVVVQMPKGVVPTVVPESVAAETETVQLSSTTVEPLSDLIAGILPTPATEAIPNEAIDKLHEFQGAPGEERIDAESENFGDIQAAQAPVEEYTEAVTDNTAEQPQELDTATIVDVNGISASQEEVAATPEFFAEAEASRDTLLASIAAAIGEAHRPAAEQTAGHDTPVLDEAAGEPQSETFEREREVTSSPSEELPPVQEQSAQAAVAAWPEDEHTEDAGAFSQTDLTSSEQATVEALTEDQYTGRNDLTPSAEQAAVQTLSEDQHAQDTGAFGQTDPTHTEHIVTDNQSEELPPVEEQSAQAAASTWPEDQHAEDTGAFGQTDPTPLEQTTTEDHHIGHNDLTTSAEQSAVQTLSEDQHAQDTFGQTNPLQSDFSTTEDQPFQPIDPTQPEEQQAAVQTLAEDQHAQDTGAFGQTDPSHTQESLSVTHQAAETWPADQHTADTGAFGQTERIPAELLSEHIENLEDAASDLTPHGAANPTGFEAEFPAITPEPEFSENLNTNTTIPEAFLHQQTQPSEENQQSEKSEQTQQSQEFQSPAGEAPSLTMFTPASQEPKSTLDLEEPIFESYHTIDYFASQGIKLQQEDYKDRLGKQLKTFSEWLRSMKRIVPTEATTSLDDITNRSIQRIAEHSVEEKEVLTEAMAEVWLKQGNIEKAISIYGKLSLLNPAKSSYFAAKIQHLKA